MAAQFRVAPAYAAVPGLIEEPASSKPSWVIWAVVIVLVVVAIAVIWFVIYMMRKSHACPSGGCLTPYHCSSGKCVA